MYNSKAYWAHMLSFFGINFQGLNLEYILKEYIILS